MAIRFTVIKTARRLTLTGWLLVASIFVALFFIWMVTIHNFLAVNNPEKTHIWVIEGYVPDSVLDSIAGLKQDSLLFLCAGLPLDKGILCPGYSNYAVYNATVLVAKGVDSSQVISAPAELTYTDRTYTTALAVKEKLKSLGYMSGKLNVVCAGTHARRSQLLYRKAFKSEWEVGVMSFPDHLYYGAWWHSSEGARAVVYEMFAYLYCAIFFHP
jgi:hypothetical protein